MKLFKISQAENHDYYTYDSAVVAAPDEATARGMNPCPQSGKLITAWVDASDFWCSSPDAVIVEYIGEAAEGTKQGVICASFNAG